MRHTCGVLTIVRPLGQNEMFRDVHKEGKNESSYDSSDFLPYTHLQVGTFFFKLKIFLKKQDEAVSQRRKLNR